MKWIYLVAGLLIAGYAATKGGTFGKGLAAVIVLGMVVAYWRMKG